MADRDTKSIEVGDVIGTTFRVWLKNVVPFTIISLIVYSPLILMAVLVPVPERGASPVMQLFQLGLQMALGSLAAGALTFGVLQAMRGKAISTGECLSTGLSRLLPVLGVSLLVGLLVVVGFMLLIVPGVILSCMLIAAVPVAVVEKAGVMAALRRSADLTKGHKVRIFFVFLALMLLGILLSIVLAIPFAGMGSVGLLLITAISLVVSGALQAALPAVIYQRLRGIKEGASVEDLAKVFD